MPVSAASIQAEPRLVPLPLDPMNDPMLVGLPRQRGFGQWIVSRMSDVRAILAYPETTVDGVTFKAMTYNLARQGVTADATMTLARVVSRVHRMPNDAERLNAVATTRLFQDALPRQDLKDQLAKAVRGVAPTTDVVAALMRPMLARWRADALGHDPELGQRIEDGLLSVIVALERLGISNLDQVEPASAAVLRDLADLEATRRQGRDIPILHWISPAFLAILPLGYTAVSMMAHLAANPDLQTALRDKPEWRAGYLREVERLMGGFRYVTRQIGPKPLALEGTALPPRSLVVMDIAAANRDPMIWDDPESCQPLRQSFPSATFVSGPLACTGGQLSRRFLALFLDAVLETVWLGPVSQPQGANRRASAWRLMRGYEMCNLALEPQQGAR